MALHKRSALKKSVKSEEAKFYKTALSSKKPKIVWKIIRRILKPNSKAIIVFPDDLNNLFSDIAENLTGKRPEFIQKTNLPDQIINICKLKELYYNDINREKIF